MAARLTPVPLDDADDERQFGGKAVSLARAIRADLPVPGGVALSAALVERIAGGDRQALDMLVSSPHLPKGRLAVRSSAIGEDSADASFAGQHVTRLNVFETSLADAVHSVWDSARSAAALAYRRKRGIEGPPSIGVVVQQLVEPLAAGVLFTRDPINGADERWIEAAWGLGEAVVAGIVSPDRYRLDRRGRMLEQVVGCKDVKIWFDEQHGTAEVAVDHALHDVPCLTEHHLENLHALADRCCSVWGEALDLEWAVTPDASVFLLQSRPITTLRA
jgi:pyruvate,water dikinase